MDQTPRPGCLQRYGILIFTIVYTLGTVGFYSYEWSLKRSQLAARVSAIVVDSQRRTSEILERFEKIEQQYGRITGMRILALREHCERVDWTLDNEIVVLGHHLQQEIWFYDRIANLQARTPEAKDVEDCIRAEFVPWGNCEAVGTGTRSDRQCPSTAQTSNGPRPRREEDETDTCSEFFKGYRPGVLVWTDCTCLDLPCRNSNIDVISDDSAGVYLGPELIREIRAQDGAATGKIDFCEPGEPVKDLLARPARRAYPLLFEGPNPAEKEQAKGIAAALRGIRRELLELRNRRSESLHVTVSVSNRSSLANAVNRRAELRMRFPALRYGAELDLNLVTTNDLTLDGGSAGTMSFVSDALPPLHAELARDGLANETQWQLTITDIYGEEWLFSGRLSPLGDAE